VTGSQVRMLTAREMYVVRGMAQGKPNAEIGRELFISEDTVKTHARRLFRKLSAKDRAHAVALAFRAGLLSADTVDVVPSLLVQASALLCRAAEVEKQAGHGDLAMKLVNHAGALRRLALGGDS
jgi:DNA-binding CsgD family transcriptional regulator